MTQYNEFDIEKVLEQAEYYGMTVESAMTPLGLDFSIYRDKSTGYVSVRDIGIRKRPIVEFVSASEKRSELYGPYTLESKFNDMLPTIQAGALVDAEGIDAVRLPRSTKWTLLESARYTNDFMVEITSRMGRKTSYHEMTDLVYR